MRGDPTGGEVLGDLALHRLPPIRPEPALVGWDRQNGLEFDDSVLALDDPDLCPRLVKVQAAAEVGRQCDGPARLDRYEVTLHVRDAA